MSSSVSDLTTFHLGIVDLREQSGESADSAAQRPSDDDLFLGIRKGDREALAILFNRYERLVLSIADRILRDKGEAEDLVQDVFLSLLSKSSLFDPCKGSARTWLVKITYHRAFDRRKYLLRRFFYDAINLESAFPNNALKTDSNGETRLELSYWQPLLREALKLLPQEQQLTLHFYFFEGYSINEIGELLGKSVINVRHYYYRGLERLRVQVFHSLPKHELLT